MVQQTAHAHEIDTFLLSFTVDPDGMVLQGCAEIRFQHVDAVEFGQRPWLPELTARKNRLLQDCELMFVHMTKVGVLLFGTLVREPMCALLC